MKLKELLEKIDELKKDYNKQGEYYDQDYDEVIKIFPLSEDSRIRILTQTHTFNRFEVYYDTENNELDFYIPENTRKVLSSLYAENGDKLIIYDKGFHLRLIKDSPVQVDKTEDWDICSSRIDGSKSVICFPKNPVFSVALNYCITAFFIGHKEFLE